MDVILPIVRFAHYAAALQLFGLTIFQALLAPESLRQHISDDGVAIARFGVWLLLLSGMAWLILATAGMSGRWEAAADPAVLLPVLTGTEFGRVWIWHSAAVIALCALILSGRLGGWRTSALLAALTLATLGLIGHATLGAGVVGLLNRGSHVLHLLASGFWVGALVPLLLCIKAFATAEHRSEAVTALYRFSGLGHVAVALVVATGVINGWLIIGGVPQMSSPYQWILAAKILLVLLMIALATINRYVLLPSIGGDQREPERLRRSTMLEIALSGGVLALVSLLGTFPPI